MTVSHLFPSFPIAPPIQPITQDIFDGGGRSWEDRLCLVSSLPEVVLVTQRGQSFPETQPVFVRADRVMPV